MKLTSILSCSVGAIAAWAAAALGATLLVINPASAAGSNYKLDHFPTEKLYDQSALQNGAKLFINHCLNCHSASAMRYNRLRDIGLTEAQIRENLLFTADKVGELMNTSLAPADAKAWFGAVPPDLSVIARAKSSHSGSGSDWLYTYLRTYYRDNTRSTGWNNALYPNVGMPHVLWTMQGQRGATVTEIKSEIDEKTKTTNFIKVVSKFDEAGDKTETIEKLEGTNHKTGVTFAFDKPSNAPLSQADYDGQIADLVAYITYMSDPSAQQRKRIGVWVLIGLSIFTLIAWQLNRAFWKDIK